MSQPAGWYDDPHDPTQLRYFDGVIWTEHRVPKASPTAAQSTIGHAQPMGGQPAQGYPQPSDRPAGQSWSGQRPAGQSPYGQYPQPGPGGYALGVPTTPDGEPLAGWGTRLWARILDGIITSVVSALVGWSFVQGYVGWLSDYMQRVIDDAARGVSTPMDMTTMQDEIAGYLIPLILVSLAISLVYETLFLVRFGATPGKMAAGIRVRRRADPGRLTVLDVLKRQAITIGSGLLGFVPLVSLVTGVIPLLDGLWPLWDDKRQALHDKIAGTNVVLRRTGGR